MSLQQSMTKDMSPKAVKKSVVSAASQRPLTIYPAAVAILGGAYALLIDINSFSVAAMALGGIVTSASWMWEYFARGDLHANRFIQSCREAIEKRRRQALGQVEKDLKSVGHDQGLKQLALFKNKFQNFVEILGRKLSTTEITYQRYLTIAEQVFLGGIDNLESAALAMKSVSAVDVEHIQREIIRLDSQSDDDKASIENLKARLTLRESQLLRAKALLIKNEKALTQLDHVTTKIAEVKTKEGRAQLDLEDAMSELQRLILRADNYSR